MPPGRSRCRVLPQLQQHAAAHSAQSARSLRCAGAIAERAAAPSAPRLLLGRRATMRAMEACCGGGSVVRLGGCSVQQRKPALARPSLSLSSDTQRPRAMVQQSAVRCHAAPQRQRCSIWAPTPRASTSWRRAVSSTMWSYVGARMAAAQQRPGRRGCGRPRA
jgi:hypothetical protein